MSLLFKSAGILLALYTCYASWIGGVYVKAGISWGRVSRRERSTYFWICIAIYAALSVLLIVWF